MFSLLFCHFQLFLETVKFVFGLLEFNFELTCLTLVAQVQLVGQVRQSITKLLLLGVQLFL